MTLNPRRMGAAEYTAWLKAGGNLRKDSGPVQPTSWDAVKTVDLSSLARTLVTEDLGPGVPITPIHPDKVEPRLFDFTPGYNIAITPRTYEDIQFPALRQMARSWDVAALCIQRNIDDLRQLKWEIRPKAIPGMDRTMVRERAKRLERNRAEVEGFWMTPDQKRSWSSWVHAFALELYETDAACLYLQKNRDGTLHAVRYVDGTTIAPLIDEWGTVPEPPEPAYRQIIRGLPWTMYMADLDLPPDERKLSFDRSHMIYEPFWGRDDSPYGHPPMEWIILTVQRALARQVLDFRLFSDGTTPYSFWRMPETWSDVQIAQAQQAFDKLMNMPQQRAHLQFMPGGANTGLENGFLEPKTEGEEFLLHIACAAYNRSPMEMGFIRQGSMGLGGRGVAQEQRKGANKGIRAVVLHIKALVDRIINLHQNPELEIVFPEMEETEDALNRAQAEDLRIKRGTLGLDEERLGYDLDPIGPSGKPSNLIFLGTNPPMLAADVLLGAGSPEPPPGGANPPSPSAVPGQETNLQVAKADIADVVYRTLLRQYPPDLLDWVKKATWRYESAVPLAQIDGERRPGGRDPANVQRIEDGLAVGEPLHPLVLVQTSAPKLAIADGWHRDAAARHDGRATVPAFIASGVGDEGPWDTAMQAKRFEKGGDEGGSPAPITKLEAPDAATDLSRWQRKAVRALKEGRSPAVRFESEAIPPDTAARIGFALAKSTTTDDVRAAFSSEPPEAYLVRAMQRGDERFATALESMAKAFADQPAPIVNVTSPAVTFPEGMVQVHSPNIEVHPPAVNIAAPTTHIDKGAIQYIAPTPEPTRTVRKRVERDDAGQITSVIEERA